jgi:hypothetical protein
MVRHHHHAEAVDGHDDTSEADNSATPEMTHDGDASEEAEETDSNEGPPPAFPTKDASDKSKPSGDSRDAAEADHKRGTDDVDWDSPVR